MENVTIACIQQRMGVVSTTEEFASAARRFLRQAQAKGARLVVFPELTGVMLAPPLISGFKLGFIKREDRGRQPQAGAMSRQLGRVSGAAATVLGGGFRGSLLRLLSKNSDGLRRVYLETFGDLAREFGTAIVGGSLYLYDEETATVRNRAYLFDLDGEVLGYQDKLNLAPDEEEIATPGSDLEVLQTRFGRLGLLIGRDLLYPELARILAMQGAELLVGIAASPGEAQATVTRSALALRVEENQVFGAASFLLGPNLLGQVNREDLFGRSALLAPISLSERGDGIVLQVGSNRSEGFVAAELDAEALHNLWETSGFRPRAQMNVSALGSILADFYRERLTLEQAVERQIAGPVQAGPAYPLSPEPELEGPVAVEPPEALAEGWDSELEGPVAVEPLEALAESRESELEDSRFVDAVAGERESGMEASESAELAPEAGEPETDIALSSVPEALSLSTGKEAAQE